MTSNINTTLKGPSSERKIALQTQVPNTCPRVGSSKIQTSVIIVTHNSESWIRDCLQAVFSQTYEYPYEVLVIDNDSTDRTRELIAQHFPDAKLIKSDNRGFGAGNNLGAKSAQGEYLAFVNPDTIAAPHWLAELVKPLTDPGIVTTSKILLMDEPDLINTCGMTLHFTGFGFVNKYQMPAESVTQDFEVHGISGAAFAMRKQDFHQVGGFDEDFFMYMEDVDLSWRMAQYGLRVLCAVKSQVKHCYSLTLPSHKIRALERGRILVLRKHLAFSDGLILWPSLGLSFVLSFVRTGMHSLPATVRLFQSVREGFAIPVNPTRQTSIVFLPCLTDHIQFSMITRSILIRGVGALFNAVFKLNIMVARMLKPKPSPSKTKEVIGLEIK